MVAQNFLGVPFENMKIRKQILVILEFIIFVQYPEFKILIILWYKNYQNIKLMYPLPTKKPNHYGNFQVT